MPTISELRRELENSISTLKSAHSSLRKDLTDINADIALVEQMQRDHKFLIWNKIFAVLNEEEAINTLLQNFSISSVSEREELVKRIDNATKVLTSINEGELKEKIAKINSDIETYDSRISKLNIETLEIENDLGSSNRKLIDLAEVINENQFTQDEFTNLVQNSSFFGRLFDARQKKAHSLNKSIIQENETISSVFEAYNKFINLKKKVERNVSEINGIKDLKNVSLEQRSPLNDKIMQADNARSELKRLEADDARKDIITNSFLNADIQPEKLHAFLVERDHKDLVTTSLELTAKRFAFQSLLKPLEVEMAVISRKIGELEEKEYKLRNIRTQSQTIDYNDGSILKGAQSFKHRVDTRSDWYRNNRSHVKDYSYEDDSLDVVMWFMIYDAMMSDAPTDFGNYNDYLPEINGEEVDELESVLPEIDSFDFGSDESLDSLDSLDEFDFGALDSQIEDTVANDAPQSSCGSNCSSNDAPQSSCSSCSSD